MQPRWSSTLAMLIVLGGSGCASPTANVALDPAHPARSAPRSIAGANGASEDASRSAAQSAAPNASAASSALPATVSPTLMTPETRGTAKACAVASLGFDRRALPTSTTAQGFDGWVLGEAESLRHAAPPDASPRILHVPGAGLLNALFDGESADAVLAACEATLKTYLAKAPHLPIIGSGSAVHVQMDCRPCD